MSSRYQTDATLLNSSIYFGSVATSFTRRRTKTCVKLTAWRHQRLLKHQFSLSWQCSSVRNIAHRYTHYATRNACYTGGTPENVGCIKTVGMKLRSSAKSNISQRVFPFAVRQVSNYKRVPVAVTSWKWFKRTWRLLNRCDSGFFYDCPLVKVSLQLFLLIPFTLTGRVITKQLHTHTTVLCLPTAALTPCQCFYFFFLLF